MPMIDVYLSESILTVEQRQVLADRLAGLARAAEGVGDSPLASRLSWVYLHPMPDFTVTRSGAAPRRPLWRIEIATPDGLLDAGAKARLSPQLVRAVLDAEADGAHQDDERRAEEHRIWVLFRDVAEGDWFAGSAAASAESLRAAIAREQASAA